VPELPPGLVEWARMSGPNAVVEAIRHRARRGFRTEAGTLRLELLPVQRREVGRLLGTSWEISGRPVRLDDLAAKLAEHGLGVRQFVEALDGRPIVELRSRRAAEQAAADAERAEATALLVEAGVLEQHVTAWLADPGLPRAGAGELIALAAHAATVWTRLPGATGDPIRLARLAAETFDDAHALDYREPLGRATARLIALSLGLPRPLSAGRHWRSAWASAGIRCDAVSSRVLALNLPLEGDAPVARLSNATPGEPLWLSLRALVGHWSVSGTTRVFVCENPTVVEAAADELGARCPPIVCTDGIPSIGALDLLAGLSAHGSALSVRADFDDAGFTAVDQVLSVADQAVLWRYDAATYAAHVGLPTPPPVADPDARSQLRRLRELYANHRAALHEEALLDELLIDLTRTSPLSD
jgi:uncharacterized protein (TIGR02679 family)